MTFDRLQELKEIYNTKSAVFYMKSVYNMHKKPKALEEIKTRKNYNSNIGLKLRWLKAKLKSKLGYHEEK